MYSSLVVIALIMGLLGGVFGAAIFYHARTEDSVDIEDKGDARARKGLALLAEKLGYKITFIGFTETVSIRDEHLYPVSVVGYSNLSTAFQDLLKKLGYDWRHVPKVDSHLEVFKLEGEIVRKEA